ncbi:MAG: hypothetical protein CSB47_07045 [Proteobacteria bacterium]|nr:MAG: hypothetical protein CSB47_07045 [Pseudomonadota bacterium]
MYKGIALFFLLALLSCSFAADLPIKRGSHQLTQAKLNNMLAAGQHLAAHAFTPAEKRQLQNWAIELFRRDKDPAAVMYAFNKYRTYLNRLKARPQPKQQAIARHEFYREMMFNWRFPRYRRGQLVLPDVIRRYNPRLDAQVKAEKQRYLREQQLLAGALQQQLRLNQQLFNRSMQLYREHGNNITQSAKDLSTINSLAITGGRVLETHPGYFVVESENGTRYTISR